MVRVVVGERQLAEVGQCGGEVERGRGDGGGGDGEPEMGDILHPAFQHAPKGAKLVQIKPQDDRLLRRPRPFSPFPHKANSGALHGEVDFNGRPQPRIRAAHVAPPSADVREPPDLPSIASPRAIQDFDQYVIRHRPDRGYVEPALLQLLHENSCAPLMFGEHFRGELDDPVLSVKLSLQIPDDGAGALLFRWTRKCSLVGRLPEAGKVGFQHW